MRGPGGAQAAEAPRAVVWGRGEPYYGGSSEGGRDSELCEDPAPPLRSCSRLPNRGCRSGPPSTDRNRQVPGRVRGHRRKSTAAAAWRTDRMGGGGNRGADPRGRDTSSVAADHPEGRGGLSEGAGEEHEAGTSYPVRRGRKRFSERAGSLPVFLPVVPTVNRVIPSLPAVFGSRWWTPGSYEAGQQRSERGAERRLVALSTDAAANPLVYREPSLGDPGRPLRVTPGPRPCLLQSVTQPFPSLR